MMAPLSSRGQLCVAYADIYAREIDCRVRCRAIRAGTLRDLLVATESGPVCILSRSTHGSVEAKGVLVLRPPYNRLSVIAETSNDGGFGSSI